MTPRLLALAPILFLTAACAGKPPAELDLSPFQNRVCDLLTLDQLKGFGINEPGVPGGDQGGQSCLWQTSGTKILVRLNEYVDKSLLKEDAGTINGFPASRWGVPGKGVQLACATTIDTRRRHTFTATVFAATHACTSSDIIASLVIDTVRGGWPRAAESTASRTESAPKDRDPEAVAVALRRLDACGVIPLDAARAAGPASVTPLPMGPHSCMLSPTADYSPGDDGVKIFVGDVWEHWRHYDGAPVTIGGAKAYEFRNFSVSKHCQIVFPVSFARAITLEYDVSGDHDTCGALRRLAESAVPRLRNPDPITVDPAKRPLAAWDGCSFLARLLGPEARNHTFEPDGTRDKFSGCRTSTGVRLEVAYGHAPETREPTRQVSGKVAEVQALGSTCALTWNQGASGVANKWFAAVMFTLAAADCDTAARLAEQAVHLAGQPPADPTAAPQHPLPYTPDEPDTAQAGACADFFVTGGEDDCKPYHPVPVPRGTEKIMVAAAADRAVQCAVFSDSVTAIFGPAFRALTWGDHCYFVEPTHTLKIQVNVIPSFPPAAYGHPTGRFPERREIDIAGRPAVTFWDEPRGSFDIYLSPFNDLNKLGAVHIQAEARPERGDATHATAKLDPAKAETATQVIADVTRKHFTG